MLQRIQTLYLLGAVLLSGGLFVLPVARIDSGQAMTSLFITGGASAHTSGWLQLLLAAVFGVTAAGNLLILFLYRNRKLQLRWIGKLLLLLLAGTILLMVFLLKTWHASQGGIFHPEPAVIFPLLAFVLMLLARRSVKKDQDLVDSLDRLR